MWLRILNCLLKDPFDLLGDEAVDQPFNGNLVNRMEEEGNLVDRLLSGGIVNEADDQQMEEVSVS